MLNIRKNVILKIITLASVNKCLNFSWYIVFSYRIFDGLKAPIIPTIPVVANIPPKHIPHVTANNGVSFLSKIDKGQYTSLYVTYY